jgi:hypothetical protein
MDKDRKKSKNNTKLETESIIDDNLNHNWYNKCVSRPDECSHRKELSADNDIATNIICQRNATG